MVTEYRNLTDRELLIEFANLRAHSPIIEELCQRIERLLRSSGGY